MLFRWLLCVWCGNYAHAELPILRVTGCYNYSERVSEEPGKRGEEFIDGVSDSFLLVGDSAEDQAIQSVSVTRWYYCITRIVLPTWIRV